MKTVILCGGLGTRLREETDFRPKPMVEIGSRPILWHIMKGYTHYGFHEFVLCLGYKGDVIRDYFYNYELRNSDGTVTLGSRNIEFHNRHTESGWRITLAETGERTLTGGRLKRAAQYLEGEQFMVTYGDGVADLDIKALLAYHKGQGKLGTVTAVHPSSRFGELFIENGLVQVFREKPQVHEGWINGGFFVFQRNVLDLISGDDESLEQGLLEKLASMKELAVYQHQGFWQCMDTYREMELLNELWRSGKAPWAVWR
ncbi:MAG: glucose-1-phosphate cytidylyltransferase [Nitrospirae bacterium]|nr:glucose-1-phosphate cytidylyltransferase [Nitrospirota bacterium]